MKSQGITGLPPLPQIAASQTSVNEGSALTPSVSRDAYAAPNAGGFIAGSGHMTRTPAAVRFLKAGSSPVGEGAGVDGTGEGAGGTGGPDGPGPLRPCSRKLSADGWKLLGSLPDLGGMPDDQILETVRSGAKLFTHKVVIGGIAADGIEEPGPNFLLTLKIDKVTNAAVTNAQAIIRRFADVDETDSGQIVANIPAIKKSLFEITCLMINLIERARLDEEKNPEDLSTSMALYLPLEDIRDGLVEISRNIALQTPEDAMDDNETASALGRIEQILRLRAQDRAKGIVNTDESDPNDDFLRKSFLCAAATVHGPDARTTAESTFDIFSLCLNNHKKFRERLMTMITDRAYRSNITGETHNPLLTVSLLQKVRRKDGSFAPEEVYAFLVRHSHSGEFDEGSRRENLLHSLQVLKHGLQKAIEATLFNASNARMRGNWMRTALYVNSFIKMIRTALAAADGISTGPRLLI